MGRIDLRGYPQNIQDVARKMQDELDIVSAAAKRARDADDQFGKALSNAFKAQQITKRQREVSFGLAVRKLAIEFATSVSSRRDIFIFDEANE